MSGTRLTCFVPHCKRTARNTGQVEPPDDVWICSKHWALIPPNMKRVKRRARRRMSAAPGNDAALFAYLRIASRCTKECIERALGIK